MFDLDLDLLITRLDIFIVAFHNINVGGSLDMSVYGVVIFFLLDVLLCCSCWFFFSFFLHWYFFIVRFCIYLMYAYFDYVIDLCVLLWWDGGGGGGGGLDQNFLSILSHEVYNYWGAR